jgi:threonine dehydratase
VNYRPSFVDGIGSRSVFPQMFERAQALIDSAQVATLAEVASALALMAERNHVIAEGAAACAVACALSGRAGGGKIVCVVSGGTIDADKLCAALRGEVPS